MRYGSILAAVALALACTTARGQERATCLYSEPFSGTGLPSGWTLLPEQVEILDQNGEGTGAFTAAWTTGTTAQANALGYFPVPDDPPGNSFAMANDDAPPCDCAMEDVSLVSPAYDLSTAPAPAVSYRVYHDGLPVYGRAWLEASTDGAVWTTLEEIPALHGTWQRRMVDLSAFTSAPVQLRFRYDDNGDWSSGMAVDDVCIFARVPDDIALVNAWLGDRVTSPFITEQRSLGYTRIPVEQQEPLLLSATLRNHGWEVATAIIAEVTITPQSGTPVTLSSTIVDALAPLRDTLVTWNTGFVADAPGQVSISLNITAASTDQEPSDNSGALSYEVTAADAGNHAMAQDNDSPSVFLGDDNGFSVGCRYELKENTATIHGISTRFGGGTAVGARVRVVIMSGELDPLHVSSMHTVTEEDLQLSFSGGTVYLPLDSVLQVSGPQDVIALVHSPPDSGTVRIAAGGNIPVGAAWLIQDPEFTISYPQVAPLVRLHLSAPLTVGLNEGAGHPALTAWFDPATTAIILAGPANETMGTISIHDVQGRIMPHGRPYMADGGRTRIEAANWPMGLYLVRVRTARGTATVRVLIQY